MSMRLPLSICIPAYNRVEFLPELLESILSQDFHDFEVVVCEDFSPQRQQIKDVVSKFQDVHLSKIRYYENEDNLGYDGNIRRLIEKSEGRFCVFMGNDDIMCHGALCAIMDILNRNPDCGVIVRSYATFDVDSTMIKQEFRYFPEEVTIPGGADAIAVAFRRSVVIPGMVLDRDQSLSIATTKFDGTLLYQLYLVGMLLQHRSVVFTPTILALRRDGNAPDFGNSVAEKGIHSPKLQTTDSSVFFVQAMLDIAMFVEESTELPVFKRIRADIGAYSYPILSIQAAKPRMVFLQYGCSILRLGFWRSPHFYIYFVALSLLGPKCVDAAIRRIKSWLGYTPRLHGLGG